VIKPDLDKMVLIYQHCCVCGDEPKKGRYRTFAEEIYGLCETCAKDKTMVERLESMLVWGVHFTQEHNRLQEILFYFYPCNWQFMVRGFLYDIACQKLIGKDEIEYRRHVFLRKLKAMIRINKNAEQRRKRVKETYSNIYPVVASEETMKFVSDVVNQRMEDDK